MSDEDEHFYVAITDPKDFRRELLSAGKDLIKLMQRLEYIKELRTQKIDKMFEFHELLREIDLIVSRLKKDLPVTKLKGLSQKIKPKEQKADLSRLQNELVQIESRLDKLI